MNADPNAEAVADAAANAVHDALLWRDNGWTARGPGGWDKKNPKAPDVPALPLVLAVCAMHVMASVIRQ